MSDAFYTTAVIILTSYLLGLNHQLVSREQYVPSQQKYTPNISFLYPLIFYINGILILFTSLLNLLRIKSLVMDFLHLRNYIYNEEEDITVGIIIGSAVTIGLPFILYYLIDLTYYINVKDNINYLISFISFGILAYICCGMGYLTYKLRANYCIARKIKHKRSF